MLQRGVLRGSMACCVCTTASDSLYCTDLQPQHAQAVLPTELNGACVGGYWYTNLDGERAVKHRRHALDDLLHPACTQPSALRPTHATLRQRCFDALRLCCQTTGDAY